MRNLVTAALIALPFAAFAQDPEIIERNIKARQGYYEMLSLNVGTLAAMAKGEIPYDEATASAAGSRIEDLTSYPVLVHFIEGSFTSDVKGTAAKPEILANADDAEQKFTALREAAAGAGEAVKGGQGNVGAVVQKLGGTCKACHDSYREKL